MGMNNSEQQTATKNYSDIFRKNETVSVGLAVVAAGHALVLARPNFLDQGKYRFPPDIHCPLRDHGHWHDDSADFRCLRSFSWIYHGAGWAWCSAITLTLGASPVSGNFNRYLCPVLLIGLINGLIVEIAGVNALITTIGTMYIGQGDQ